MDKIFNIILGIIDLIFPKNKRKIAIPCVIDSEWQGNCAFIYQYIKSVRNIYGVDVRILVNNSSKLSNIKDISDDILPLKSFSGLYYLFTSGVVIYHHGAFAGRIPLMSKRRLNLQINHGIHFKKVELALDPDCLEYKNSSKVKTKWFCEYHTVSSHIDALACCTYYHVKLNDVKITGIPRNDLFNNFDEKLIPATVKDDINKLNAIIQGRKIIAYAPTFRNVGSAYQFNDDEIKLLDEFLEKNNAVFCYAGHPYLKERIVPKSKNIIDFNNEFNDIQSLLLLSNVLITDYSSVWLDFLLTNQPVISFQFDKETYRDDRGFLYNVDKIFPGDTIETFDCLLVSLERALLSNKSDCHRYQMIKAMFHEYSDGNNCKRIVEFINEKKGWL
ncbi:CDP-glycerol glycerophosphotransferase family protein [Photobacterium sp. Alg240-V54]|uniref:CDP-glycerol glycerophosphotransferase family protein n=1 Tax=Photobacterium sp. Alg240-V54 TaxID=2305995 RepID=UPI0013D4DDBC|nr:CDP-glycerol glycerophosphotransferase family protein [Photobacterium sp. Alg240-V54]